MVLCPRINRGFRIERIQFNSDMLVRLFQSSSNPKVVTPKSLFFLFPSEDFICACVIEYDPRSNTKTCLFIQRVYLPSLVSGV